jgi:hypothetical protein
VSFSSGNASRWASHGISPMRHSRIGGAWPVQPMVPTSLPVVFPWPSGLTWTQTSLPANPVTNVWTGVASSADGVNLVAVCGSGSGAIFTSVDSGSTWQQQNAFNNDYSCIACSPDGTKMVVGEYYGNLVLTSTDSGRNWSSNSAYEFENSVSISADGESMAMVGGSFLPSTNVADGYVFYSTNAGGAWHLSDAPTNILWQGVACSSGGSFLVAVGRTESDAYSEADGGSVYISTNYGVNWEPADLPSLPWWCVACSTNGQKIVVADLGDPGSGIPDAVYCSTNFGGNWFTNDVIQGSSATLAAENVVSSADGTKLAANYGNLLINPPPVSGGGSGPPRLTIRYVPPGSVVVSWPTATSYSLQQNPGLSAAQWVTNSHAVTSNNGTNSITISPPLGDLFFRLISP